MALNNVYVGERYVPLYCGEWSADTDYESLSIVSFEGASYISNRPAPAGTELTNTAYWAKTSDTNAQIVQFEKTLQDMQDQLNNITDEVGVVWTPAATYGITPNSSVDIGTILANIPATANIGLPAGEYIINANTRIQCAVYFAPGACIKTTSTSTVTLNFAKPIKAGNHQIFDGVKCYLPNTFNYPLWWGTFEQTLTSITQGYIFLEENYSVSSDISTNCGGFLSIRNTSITGSGTIHLTQPSYNTNILFRCNLQVGINLARFDKCQFYTTVLCQSYFNVYCENCTFYLPMTAPFNIFTSSATTPSSQSSSISFINCTVTSQYGLPAGATIEFCNTLMKNALLLNSTLGTNTSIFRIRLNANSSLLAENIPNALTLIYSGNYQDMGTSCTCIGCSIQAAVLANNFSYFNCRFMNNGFASAPVGATLAKINSCYGSEASTAVNCDGSLLQDNLNILVTDCSNIVFNAANRDKLVFNSINCEFAPLYAVNPVNINTPWGSNSSGGGGGTSQGYSIGYKSMPSVSASNVVNFQLYKNNEICTDFSSCVLYYEIPGSATTQNVACTLNTNTFYFQSEKITDLPDIESLFCVALFEEATPFTISFSAQAMNASPYPNLPIIYQCDPGTSTPTIATNGSSFNNCSFILYISNLNTSFSGLPMIYCGSAAPNSGITLSAPTLLSDTYKSYKITATFNSSAAYNLLHNPASLVFNYHNHKCSIPFEPFRNIKIVGINDTGTTVKIDYMPTLIKSSVGSSTQYDIYISLITATGIYIPLTQSYNLTLYNSNGTTVQYSSVSLYVSSKGNIPCLNFKFVDGLSSGLVTGVLSSSYITWKFDIIVP